MAAGPTTAELAECCRQLAGAIKYYQASGCVMSTAGVAAAQSTLTVLNSVLAGSTTTDWKAVMEDAKTSTEHLHMQVARRDLREQMSVVNRMARWLQTRFADQSEELREAWAARLTEVSAVFAVIDEVTAMAIALVDAADDRFEILKVTETMHALHYVLSMVKKPENTPGAVLSDLRTCYKGAAKHVQATHELKTEHQHKRKRGEDGDDSDDGDDGAKRGRAEDDAEDDGEVAGGGGCRDDSDA